MSKVTKSCTSLYELRLRISAFATVMALLLLGVGPLVLEKVSAAQIQDRSLRLSNSQPSQSSQYEISMTLPTAGILGSLKVDFCSNSALLYRPCTAPTGFTLAGATITNQSGVSGFSIDPASTANSLILSRPPSAIGAGTIAVTLTGITNQAAAGSSFARYYTYVANNASGPVTDDGAVAFSLNDSFSVSAEVPPYLTFCVGTRISGNDCTQVEGDFVQLGQFSTTRASSGQLQMALNTNAPDGYTIRVQGQTMTSGNNTIPALVSMAPSAPGTNQFGINLRANTNPASGSNPVGPGTGQPVAAYGQPNAYKYGSGDVVATGTSYEDYRKYTVTYLVNINRSQPPGVYSSSFSYIALGNF